MYLGVQAGSGCGDRVAHLGSKPSPLRACFLPLAVSTIARSVRRFGITPYAAYAEYALDNLSHPLAGSGEAAVGGMAGSALDASGKLPGASGGQRG